MTLAPETATVIELPVQAPQQPNKLEEIAEDVNRVTTFAHALSRMTEHVGELTNDDREAIYLVACEIVDAGRRLEENMPTS